MARAKRTSITLQNAERRIAGMESIDVYLDLGNDLTLDAFRTEIDEDAARSKTPTTGCCPTSTTYTTRR